MNLKVRFAPHIHSADNTHKIMGRVCISLIPSAVAGIYFFGLRALLVLLLSCVGAVGTEFLWQTIAKKPSTISDLSALVTGLLLGLCLPVSVDWWIPVIGSAVAIALVKQLFGGIGDNFVNPALAARAVLLASWPVAMTKFVLPSNSLSWTSAEDMISSATVLGGKEFSTLDLFLGNVPGTIGEGCKIAILLGFVYLLITKVISWEIPVFTVLSVAGASFLLGLDPLEAVLSGGVIFGAVFMATDYTTSPMYRLGRIVYAIGIGIIIVVIRKWGGYPEGVTYAILLMNIVTPLIDRAFKHRAYGEEKKHEKG